ncbi:MAG: tetratricopeptide repeat protein, partial [Pirellulales bacterium]
ALSMDPEPEAAPARNPPSDDAPAAVDEPPAADQPAAGAAPDAPPSETATQQTPSEQPSGDEKSPAPPQSLPADAGPKPTPIAPAALDGVQPGTTTRKELHEKWGHPKKVDRIAGGARETYRLDKLGSARVTITEDVVQSLAVHVANPLALPIVVARLAIDDVEGVNIYDESGELLGAAYPERGALLGYVPKSHPPRVFQIVVEPIDAQPFMARAQARFSTRYADCLTDVKQALELAPDSAAAYCLKAEVALRSGDLDAALTAAQKAIELAPDAAEHRLLLARVLAAAGDYPQAIARVRDVIGEPNLPDVVAARAWCQWGDCLAKSAKRDYAGAIKHHQRAIKLAEPLARHDQYAVRRAAKELLVDAHLAVAYDIGWGRWQQKSTVVPNWIDRAKALADQLVDHERVGPEIHLRVYAQALAALAGIAQPPDAGKWIRGAGSLGTRLYDDAVDGTYRAHIARQMAVAFSHAVEIEAARHQLEQAVSLGNMALELFDDSQSVSARLPTHHYERGRLCYRMGVVYALDRGDHAAAVAWFDRAALLLEKPVPATAVDVGTQGEAFVSMAVTYWDLDNRSEALRLTSQGLKLMEQAVGEGLLDAAALAIPYGNLASMHDSLGDVEAAKKFSELSARHEAAPDTK